jgi:methylenetetrahydrofolate reductase (NADPH)
MASDGFQLEMNFDNSMNRFRHCLDNGVFLLLFEMTTPARDIALSAAGDRLQEIEYTVSNINEFPSGIAITDKFIHENGWNVADYASCLSKDRRDRHIVYISGRNASLDDQIKSLKICGANGLINIVPVSGNSIQGETIRATRKRTFTESIHLLQYMQKLTGSQFFPGGVVNPFKYTQNDSFTQYFKLVKKLNSGAEFIVTNFGWDMMKLQELRWYLSNRNLHYPSIARLLVLTPERVEKIISGSYPGVHISPDFKTILENELKYSYNQFESAQWRRLQLQAAGCKLLGYSGIQIAGLDNSDKIKIAARRIAEGMAEFQPFTDWTNEYFEHLARAEMAPYPHRFYMFGRGFTKPYAEGAPQMVKINEPASSASERFNYKLRKFMFPHADRQNSREHFISKKLLAGCRECSYCRLPLTQFVCPELCPKGLANGPCGGTQADGNCELGEIECIHSQIMRLAVWQNQADRLEETYIGPAIRKIK